MAKKKTIIFKISLIFFVICVIGSNTALGDFPESTVTEPFFFNIGSWTTPTPPNPPCGGSISERTCGCGVTLITNPTTHSVDFLKFQTFGCGFPTWYRVSCWYWVMLRTNSTNKLVYLLNIPVWNVQWWSIPTSL